MFQEPMQASSDLRMAAAQAEVIAAMYQRLRHLAQALEKEVTYLGSLSPEDRKLADGDPLEDLFGRLLEGHDELARKLAELGEILASRDLEAFGQE